MLPSHRMVSMKINFFFVFILLISCGKNSDSPSGKRNDSIEEKTQSSQASDLMSSEEEYVSLLNNYREKLNLNFLIHSSAISEVASSHSEDMALEKVPFGHRGFSGRCQRIKSIFPTMNSCAEVVAWGQDHSQEVLEAWLNSSPHRRTLEGEHFTHTGIASFDNGDGDKYWTQILIQLPNDK